MWCEQCGDDVIPLSNGEQTGNFQCPRCESELQPVAEAGNASIAQTAHALLKRWEQSRPTTDSQSSISDYELPDIDHLIEPASANNVQPVVPQRIPEPTRSPNLKKETATQKSPQQKQNQAPVSSPQPTRQPEARKVETTTQPVLRKPVQQQSVQQQPVKKTVQPTVPKSVPKQNAKTNTKTFSLEKLSTPVKTPRKSPTQPLASKSPSLAAQNSAGALLNRDPLKSVTSKKKKTRTPTQAQAKTNTQASSQTPNLAPAKRTEEPMKNISPEQILDTTSNQGRVRFAAAEEKTGTIDDLGIQQAIETHHRKRRNWSVFFGQLMVFCGAIGMTCGVAIVIGNRFGSLEIVETTGWLALAGGHLLFVLGIYSYLSSKLDQIWTEMHTRNDDLARLIIEHQMQTAPTGNSPRIAGAVPNTTRDVFQRGTLQESA